MYHINVNNTDTSKIVCKMQCLKNDLYFNVSDGSVSSINPVPTNIFWGCNCWCGGGSDITTIILLDRELLFNDLKLGTHTKQLKNLHQKTKITMVNILAKSTPPPPPPPLGGGRNKLLPCFFKNWEEISFDPKEKLHGKNQRVLLKNLSPYST